MSKQQKSEAEKKAISTLAGLRDLCQAKKTVTFKLRGQDAQLEVRCLTPAEQAEINEMIEVVRPPIQRGATPEHDRINWEDADFIKRKQKAMLQARAKGLYLAVDAFQQDKPGLTNIEQIASYIQSQLTEEILALLWRGIVEDGMKVEAAVNFT